MSFIPKNSQKQDKTQTTKSHMYDINGKDGKINKTMVLSTLIPRVDHKTSS